MIEANHKRVINDYLPTAHSIAQRKWILFPPECRLKHNFLLIVLLIQYMDIESVFYSFKNRIYYLWSDFIRCREDYSRIFYSRSLFYDSIFVLKLQLKACNLTKRLFLCMLSDANYLMLLTVMLSHESEFIGIMQDIIR